MASILFVLSAADTLTLRKYETHPTGIWAEELVTAYQLFHNAGWDITYATLGGNAVTIDPASFTLLGGLPKKTKRLRNDVDRIRRAFEHPAVLEEVPHEDFDVVFYLGGHAMMEDLANSEASGALLVERITAQRPLAMLSYAPSAARTALYPHGSNAFAGRKMTGMSNKEALVFPFSWKALWFVEDEMKRIGISYSCGKPRRPHVVVDGALYSGQNPQSTAALCERLLADCTSL